MKEKPILKVIAVMFLILIVGTVQVSALDLVKKNEFRNKHFLGARIGMYSNTSNEIPTGNDEYTLDFSSGSLFAEFFYAYSIVKPLSIEFSMGVFNRGDVAYNSQDNVWDRAVLIYPFWLSGKFYPLFNARTRIHPYLQSGIGMIYGRRDKINVELSYIYNDYVTNTDSEVKFTYLLGGGIDFQVHSKIALTASVKYMPVKFGQPLAEVKDYSGWLLTFGAGYLFDK